VVKAFVLRFAKMPSEPHIPEGTQGSVKMFHPGRNYYKLRVFLWALANLLGAFAVVAFAAGAFLNRLPPLVHNLWLAAAWVVVAVFIASLPLTFLIQRLNYEMRWYIVTDRSLRIRQGIVSVEELTMTFANIQEIRVAVNPLQRLLGLADVNVHSAGGASGERGSSTGHVASFESVDNAAEIRDLMMERLRVYRDSGLGHHPEADQGADVLTEVDAALAVLQEVKALRLAMDES
jgi:membrane protein YdbS with pleckstrin-like domain